MNLTLKQAAESLGVTPDTLRQAIRAGSLRGEKFGPVWTVTPREVERYRSETLGRKGPKPKRKPA